MTYTDENGEVFRKLPAWILPVGVMGAVFVISAVFLLYYLAPGGGDLFREQIAPTSSSETVTLTLGGQKFAIPANYLEYASTRKGGAVREIALFARLPKMAGWSHWQAEDFNDNGPNSHIIYLTLRPDPNRLSEAERLKRVYSDYIKGGAKPGPHGLAQYDFRDGTAYRNEDFFVGQTDTGPVILRCDRQSNAVPSPNCLREQWLPGHIALSYRFKRAYLWHWRQITKNIDTLVTGFRPVH